MTDISMRACVHNSSTDESINRCEVVDHVLSWPQGVIVWGVDSLIGCSFFGDPVFVTGTGRQRKVEQLLIGVLATQDTGRAVNQLGNQNAGSFHDLLDASGLL